MAAAMSIESWGPKAWGFLHAASFAYSDTPSPAERRAGRDFLRSLAIVPPCATCRRHFAEECARALADGERSRVLDDRASLTRWLVDVHNDVNARTGKRIVGYGEVCQVYQPSAQLCRASFQTPPVGAEPSASPDGYVVLCAIVAALLGALLLVLYRARREACCAAST